MAADDELAYFYAYGVPGYAPPITFTRTGQLPGPFILREVYTYKPPPPANAPPPNPSQGQVRKASNFF